MDSTDRDPPSLLVGALEGRRITVFTYSTEPPEWPCELTASERDIARRLIRGASVEEIARWRGSSPNTVSKQLTALYAKLGVDGRYGLVALLFRRDR